MKINRGLFSNTIDQDEKRDADVETAISTKEKKKISLVFDPRVESRRATNFQCACALPVLRICFNFLTGFDSFDA